MNKNFFCLRTNSLKCEIENNFGIFRHNSTKVSFHAASSGFFFNANNRRSSTDFFLGKKTFSKFLQALFDVSHESPWVGEKGRKKKGRNPDRKERKIKKAKKEPKMKEKSYEINEFTKFTNLWFLRKLRKTVYREDEEYIVVSWQKIKKK